MGAPTSVACSVDNTEYSRYETDNNTVTVSVSALGGAPYSGEEIEVELRKARRARDAVVATETITLSGNADPNENEVTFYLPDLVDQDLISLIRHGKYFVRATYSATAAFASIGSGANGTVTLTADDEGTAGNSKTIEVVVPAGTSSLNVTESGDAITVNLAVSGGSPIAAENTAVLVAAEINLTINDVTAVASGSGSSSLSAPEGPTSFTGGTDEASDDSADFDIRIVTVERFRSDWLFGIPLESTAVLTPKKQPTIEGVTITKLSRTHGTGLFDLTYSYNEIDDSDATANIGSGVDGTVTITADGTVDVSGSDGNGIEVNVIAPTSGTAPLTVAYNSTTRVLDVTLSVSGGSLVPADNTATLVAAEIDSLSEFSATASGTGATSLSSDEGPTLMSGGVTTKARFLSWNGGDSVPIAASGVYVLPSGANSTVAKNLLGNKSEDYVCVRISSVAGLPESTVVERILIDRQEITDETLGRYISEAVAYVENDLLQIYVEPTNVVTDRDPTTIQYTAGINSPAPILTDTDFDFLVSPLTYFIPRDTGEWVGIQFPYPKLLRVDSLFGAIANTRVIDIDLEWIELSENGGFTQLVPFNQEIAFDFIGLLWVNSLRGATELPNFWHFNAIAGLRDCPAELQELISKVAAINALTAAALAFRPGIGSQSLSRDGVSESVTYNTQATYGVYTGTIQAYKDWLEENETKLRAKYRGSIMAVV